MHQIRFRLGLQTPLGELTALPRPPTWILEVLLVREAMGGEEAKTGKEREGTKRGRKGRQAPPSPSQSATPLGQASHSRLPGLWVT